MADVSHELGSLRHIVDSPLSSKVAMFNKVANQHNASQLLNPFTNIDGRSSPKPSFSKDEYGKPLAGSMTEMRGQKANIHVCKEMLELCQIINSEGFPDQENPDLRIIFFGDLFNIYNYISDKVVGLLLRARKHKLVDFEGEMLFQRRDDEVPIFLVKPIHEIRKILEAKQEEFRRSVSPAPQPTTVLQDRLKRITNSPRSAPTSKAASPQPEVKKISTTTSVTSLETDLKPPIGQTLNSIVTKSSETLNGIMKPVEKSISEQTIDSIPIIINGGKSNETINNVIKSKENLTTVDSKLIANNIIEIPKEEIIKDKIPSTINIIIGEAKSKELPINGQQISESKIVPTATVASTVSAAISTVIPATIQATVSATGPLIGIVPATVPVTISATIPNTLSDIVPAIVTSNIPATVSAIGTASAVTPAVANSTVVNHEKEPVTDKKSEVLLNGQLGPEMDLKSQSNMSVVRSTNNWDSTTNSNSTINSQQINKIDGLLTESKQKLDNKSQTELLAVNNIESNRSNSFIGDVAPQ